MKKQFKQLPFFQVDKDVGVTDQQLHSTCLDLHGALLMQLHEWNV